MQLRPYQQSVVDEKHDLDEKITQIKYFVGSFIFADVDSDEKDRLQRQLTHMMQYSAVLAERIAAFS